MHSTRRDQPVQSIQPTVVFSCVYLSNVPIWRQVIPREDTVEGNLVMMSPEGAAELRSRHAMARCAQEEGKWETALSNLLCCRDILRGEQGRMGKLSYGSLLLWAGFSLAQMYQLRGRAEGSPQLLEKAVEVWTEIFADIELQVDPRLSSFLNIAQYECGCWNGDSEMKAEAMQNFASAMGYRREDNFEPELCLFLSYDCYWSGSFEDSLKWIQKANLLWRQLLPPAYLRWEICVLMKLHRCTEALRALDRLSSTQVPEEEVVFRNKEVRCWRRDCYRQMNKSSASDGDLQNPNMNEDITSELKFAQEYSLNLNEEKATQDGNIEAAAPLKQIIDEMLTPDLPSFGSWLSESLQTVKDHVELPNFPEGPRIALLFEMASNKSVSERLNCCREILRSIKKGIDYEAYYMILASLDNALAHYYQFGVQYQFEKALDMRKESLNCIQHVALSDKYMVRHYTSLVMLTEYQGCPPDDVPGKMNVVQEYASLMGLSKERAECDMCFWLLFGDDPRRKLHWLKDEVIPRWEHSGIAQSISYAHLIRWEVELKLEQGVDVEDPMKMVEKLREQAEDTLNRLIHRFEGQSSYETLKNEVLAEVHCMLEETYQRWSDSLKDAGNHDRAGVFQEMADMEFALQLSLAERPGIDVNPKMARSIFVNGRRGMTKGMMPPSIMVNNKSQVVQAEEHIMEQNWWIRIPSDIYLAFHKLYDSGRYAQDEGDWQCAIFNLELCRDLLLKKRTQNAEYDYTLAWIDIYLVQLYQMKMKNLKRSLHLRNELRVCLGSFTVVSPLVTLNVNANFHAAIYHCVHSKYPSLIDGIMDEIMKFMPKLRFDVGWEENARVGFLEMYVHVGGGGTYIGSKDFWEFHIVTQLIYWHFVEGDYETILQINCRLKQVVEKHFPDDTERKEMTVVFEATCLMELKLFQDANLVLQKVIKGRHSSKLSRQILRAKEFCDHRISGVHTALFDTFGNIALSNLRITGAYSRELQMYDVSVYCYDACIRIIEADKNDPSRLHKDQQGSSVLTDHRGQPGWYDYFQRGISVAEIFKTMMRKNRQSLSSHPHSSNVDLEAGPSMQDVFFLSALLSFQQQIKLLLNPDIIARANHEILKLYATMDESYFGYLLIKHGLKDAHDSHFDHGVADVNNVKLMEDDNHRRKPQFKLTSTEMSILDEVEASMIKYGRRTSVQFANSLYARKGQYTESWINVLEGHKDVYAKLQVHYLNKIFLAASTVQDDSQAEWGESIDKYRWMAFVYAERQRSRVLLYQLGPQKRTAVVAHHLWEFDTNDLHAMGNIQDHVAALEEDSVFVEYNHLQEGVWIIYVAQAGKLSHYLLTIKSEMKRMREAINNVLLLVNGKAKKRQGKKTNDKYNDVDMNNDLEYLHNLLIEPITSHLCQMKLRDKLIFAPTELLAKVPFAALRDSTKSDKEKYLVQRHTISMAPSLRAYKSCNKRLEDLQKLDPLLDPGAIVALGNPTYGRHGVKIPLAALPGTRKEVESITQHFPNTPVVKLMREDATAEKLLCWVQNPLQKSSRQVIVHIGAHGMVDEIDDRNSCLFLATSISPGQSTACGESRMYDDEHDEVGGNSRMDDELDMVESYEVAKGNEGLVKIMSDVVDQAICQWREKEDGADKVGGIGNVKSKEKDKGKGKVEEKVDENTEEKDKEKSEGKDEKSTDFNFSDFGEVPIEKIVEFAERTSSKVMIRWDVFLEYPEIEKKPKNKFGPPKTELGPHVCSVLTLKDISDSELPWRAELVVLSACLTSQGKATAEGLLNLARAFIIAGVPCIMASQWTILDEYTAVLMDKFYDNLRNGNDVASSLRSAMSSMIDAGLRIQAWAPFVIWGSSSLALPEYLR